MSNLPHLTGEPEAEVKTRWGHIFAGTWTGYPHTPSSRANMCDHPGVMLTRPGSNSVLGGFADPEEAETYRELFDENWKICDRRDDPSPGM